MSGPLEGVRVAELIEKGPGAHVTMVLADMGADVIKVEPPSRGRESGSGGSAREGDAKVRAANIVNRGKRSIVLDLKAPAGQEALRRLVRTCDVLIEGFRPGVTRRLGADYETLSKENPRLVYCSLSGYGQDGPYRDIPGHDINYIAMAGILSLVGQAESPPVVPPNLIADHGGAALHAICGITMALYARHRTGRGQLVDISYLDSALSLLGATRSIRQYLSDRITTPRGSGALGGRFCYYRVYETRDRRYLSIGCVEPWLWENLCKALNRTDLLDGGPRREDFTGTESERQQKCGREFEQLFKTRDRDEWFDLLKTANVCVAKVYEVPEIFGDPHLIHRQMVTSVDCPGVGQVPQIGVPIKLSDTPGSVGALAPWKGQHSDELLGELGYSQSEVTELHARGVV